MMESTLQRGTEDTKNLLMDSARHLFAKNGYAGTSVKNIADHAGVNISLISYHFGGKENLYSACLDSFLKEKIKFFETYVLSPTSQEDFRLRLKIFIEEMIRSELEQPDSVCIIRRDAEMENPATLDVFKKTIAKLFEYFVNFFKEGQKQGYIRQDLDPRAVSLFFIGGIQNALRTNNLRKKLYGVSLYDPKERENFINTSLDIFFNGVAQKKP